MNEIKRKVAAELLDAIAMKVAEAVHGTAQPPPTWAQEMTALLESGGIGIPKPCPGEAHQPGGHFIDNCSVCAPSWGWVVSKTKVK